jgi:hypothetical protein
MTTLVTPAQIQSAIVSIGNAIANLPSGQAGQSGQVSQLQIASGALGVAACRFSALHVTCLNAQAALTTAAGELSGANATAATTAATAVGVALAAVYGGTAAQNSGSQGGEVAQCQAILTAAAANLSAGAALTAVQAALSTLSGTYS